MFHNHFSRHTRTLFYLPNSEATNNLASDSELNDPQLRLDVIGSTVDSCVGFANALVEVLYAGESDDIGIRAIIIVSNVGRCQCGSKITTFATHYA